MTLLKGKVLQTKIVKQFQKNSQKNMKKAVFRQLSTFREEKQTHMNIVKSHIGLREEEQNQETLRAYFNAMKDFFIGKRFKNLAR